MIGNQILLTVSLLLALLIIVSCQQAQQNENRNKQATFIKEKEFYEQNYKDTNNLKEDSSRIEPSNIFEDIKKKKEENPNISAKEEADFGNELLKTKGLNFVFDWEPKGKINKQNLAKSKGEDLLPYNFKFRNLKGNEITLQLMNKGFDHPCFSTIEIPITQVNEKILTIISNEKQVVLKRPKEFYLEEFALVDERLKKPIRKWKTPIDRTPVGISPDGKKVYIESELEELAVEISEDGSLKFVDAKEIPSDKGVNIDYDKKFTEIIYRKYKAGDKHYILKFSSPCT